MRRALVLAVPVAAFAVGGHVDAKAKAGPSSVTVGINVKLAPNIKAKSSALAVSDDGTNLTFQIPLESLKEENGPPGRGGAMRKFLQVEQFPTMEGRQLIMVLAPTKKQIKQH